MSDWVDTIKNQQENKYVVNSEKIKWKQSMNKLVTNGCGKQKLNRQIKNMCKSSK